MNQSIRTEAGDFLFDAVLKLKTREECYAFFEDLCTVNELASFSQRALVAYMLRKKNTYLEIAEKTGASTATISRVNRALNYSTGGMKELMERMDEKRGIARPREDEE
ncbi:MAG: TrpR YerC/YecD [Lachnospiraceae bacterium]|nr:TrpR YerC/YecD [Lachnospiraceae bacterium]